MARFLLSTEILVITAKGADSALRDDGLLGRMPLADVAVSALSLEWIAAEAEVAPSYSALLRKKLRQNLQWLRIRIEAEGGSVLYISSEVLRHWGDVFLLDLKDDSGGEIPTEERLVVATALAEGLTYFCYEHDWCKVLAEKLGVSLSHPEA